MARRGSWWPWGAAAPAMALFLSRMQNPVEGGFRSQVFPLICQTRHDLTGRQAGMRGGMAGLQHPGPFFGTELVSRFRTRCCRAAIDLDVFPLRPALIGAQTQRLLENP